MGTLITAETAEDKELYEWLSYATKKYMPDMYWLIAHHDDLVEEYPDEWVAAYDGEVIDHDPDLEKLRDRLRERFGDDTNLVAVQFIAPEEGVIIV